MSVTTAATGERVRGDPWSRVEGRPDIYDYVPADASGQVVQWHVNFADAHLFVAYAGPLFAQDEMQVAEHPALGALRESLVAGGHSPRTVQDGRPTPITISGVERRCVVATNANAAEGRAEGLYGNHFAAADLDVVRRATRSIRPPTLTNLIAMAALEGGTGAYTRHEIEHTLVTAYTGFRAAVCESGGRPATVHTGFWGCGAFGGNRRLMAMLQVIAAELAGVHRLVFHALDEAGVEALEQAEADWRRRVRQGEQEWAASEVIERIEACGYRWGVSDGN